MMSSAEVKNMPGILLHALHRARINAVQTELHERGLSDLGSPMILFILEHRGDHGEIASQRELAQALRVSQATIATSLKSLERLGYVEKRLDDRDNRRNRIAITEKGVAAVKQCHEIFDAIDRRMMEGFSPQEREELDRLQHRMLDNLRAYKENGKGGCCPCCEN
ncbi:MAG: MarR family winged helix-turn-helix transcriptional regulator [Oscillospiraceae bacterium]